VDLPLTGSAGLLEDPVTMASLVDPVVTSDGNTYSREYIEAWFARCRTEKLPLTSPSTNEVVTDVLIPNKLVAKLLQLFD
jgi:hypothetical protein